MPEPGYPEVVDDVTVPEDADIEQPEQTPEPDLDDTVDDEEILP